MKTISVCVNGTSYPAAPGSLLSDLPPFRHDMAFPCGGKGLCGKCRAVVSGEVSPITEGEIRLLGKDAEEGVRLVCQTRVLGNCTVTFQPESAMEIHLGGQNGFSPMAPRFHEYGLAIDIGTTTLAAQLYDAGGTLLGEMGLRNPQAALGADVITRMDAALHGKGDTLIRVLREAISLLIRDLAKRAGIRPDQIDGAVITGNTTMLHFLTGTPVEPLSCAPFQPNRLFGETVPASDCGIAALSPSTPILLPPCLSAFVGADSVTALLYAERNGIHPYTLLMDIGTNGEILLRTETALYACSTAAGPAFEGAGISCGMMGSAGAIDKVSLVNGKLHCTTIHQAPPVGICGSGLLDAVACLLMTEELDETGLLEESPVRLTDPVMLTQDDIRQVQLAKGAVSAGIRTLLHIAGRSTNEIRQWNLAGGFGSSLNVISAKQVGLLPPVPDCRITVLGNAALCGAALLLLEEKRMEEALAIARTAVPVELSANPIFTEEFVKGMLFG